MSGVSQDQPAQPPAAPQPAAEPASPPAPVQVRLRRAPRYRVFVLLGALVGVVLGVGVAVARSAGDGLFSAGTVSAYLGGIGLLLGALAGAAVAVLLDRPAR